MSVVEILNQYGFATLAAIAMGYFIFFIYKFTTENLKNKLGEENYQDDKINVKLHYFICSHFNGEIILSEHEDSAWITKNEFKNYNFAEGDSDIIKLL